MITRNNNKMNIPMLLACVLLCCVMISFHFVSGLYARYSTTSTGEDSARVAKFDVDLNRTSFSNTMDISFPDDTLEDISLQINNKSEVAIRYVITAKNESGNLPLKFIIDSTEGNGTCSANGQLLPLTMGAHILSIEWIDPFVAYHYMGQVDLITLTIDVEQID